MTAMDGFSVQADELAMQAPKYESVAQQLAQLGQALQSAVAEYSGCWGGDEAGSLFFNKYGQPSANAAQQMSNGVESLQSLADTVHGWAQSYPATDAAT